MKGTILSLLFLCGMMTATAQTATLTQITAPCNDDGVVVTSTTGLTPPLTFSYYTGWSFTASVVHYSSTSLTDTLSHWSGGYVRAIVTGAAGGEAIDWLTSGPFTDSVTTVIATCPAPSTATIIVTSGTGPYTYKWFNDAGIVVSTASTLSTSVPGYYTYEIANSAGCHLNSRSTQDTAVYMYGLPPFTFTLTHTNASCLNGTASVTGISGGTLPYSYIWSNGATTSSISGLTMGDYYVDITDGAGCSTAYHNYVSVGQTPVITVNTTPTPATCLNSDGAVIAFGSGGVPPYTYLWSNGSTSQSQTGLPAGSLSVTAVDAHGCRGNGGAYISVSSPVTVTYSSTASSCTAPTGTATVAVAGGTGPYSVLWYTSPVQTGVTATNLSAGFYSFLVTDNVGCTRTGTVYVPPVDVISAYFTATNPVCTAATGVLSVFPSGGVPPYTYSWSTGGTTSSIAGLTAGGYSVTITDHNGCTLVKKPNLNNIEPIHIAFTSTPEACLYSNNGSLTAVPSGGTGPYTYNWNTGATTATITGLHHGTYWVVIHDAAGCNTYDTTVLGYDHTTDYCYCTVSGHVYHDVNGNCIQDSGEPGIHNIQMHCSGMGYTYTDTTGFYSFKVPTGSYAMIQSVLSYYPLSSCQIDSIPFSVTAASGCNYTINYADSLNPIHDVRICTWNLNAPIPGHTYLQKTIVANEGTVTESGILAGYKTDGQLFSPSFVPSGVFSLAGTNWYNTPGTFPSMAAGTTTSFDAGFPVPTNIPLGTDVVFKDSVAYAAPMSNWLTDYSPWNNVKYLHATVVASYDPNFKEVSPKGWGPDGVITRDDSVLEYMVHFQNTGTCNAENIVVIDTLDPHVDWTTLHPIYQSHGCNVSVTEGGVATFTFDYINLVPQSEDDQRSCGMFTYSVKTIPGQPLGTRFKNRAAIYFDYNPPIYTNTTVNTLAWPESTPTLPAPTEMGSFTIFPNPANSAFNAIINLDKDERCIIAVTDVTGKTLIRKPFDLQKGKQTVNVDVASLTSGVYFVSLTGGTSTQTQKLVIIK